MKAILELIFAERERQRARWSDDHDDQHTLVDWCNLANESLRVEGRSQERSLIVFGALMMAAIQAVDRQFSIPTNSLESFIKEAVPRLKHSPTSYQELVNEARVRLDPESTLGGFRAAALTFLCYAVRLIGAGHEGSYSNP